MADVQLVQKMTEMVKAATDLTAAVHEMMADMLEEIKKENAAGCTHDGKFDLTTMGGPTRYFCSRCTKMWEEPGEQVE